MNREPKTLRQLLEVVDKGYIVNVWIETRCDDGEIRKKQVGGFKKVGKCSYQWLEKGKWLFIYKKMHELMKFFAIDAIGYKLLTGKNLTARIVQKFGSKDPVDAFARIDRSRRWNKSEDYDERVVVRAYRDIKKKNHAIEMYNALEDFCMGADIEAVSPEFTIGHIKITADMVAVHHDKIEVFGIKSKGDSLKKLSSQIESYKTYADKVWAVIDISLASKFDKWCSDNPKLSSWLGYMSYDNGKIDVVQRAKANIPSVSYLSLLWETEKRQILFGLGMPSTYESDNKDIAQYIKKACLDVKERYETIAKMVIIDRITKLYNGKCPNNDSIDTQACGGVVPLKILLSIVYGEIAANKLIVEDTGCKI